MPTLTDILSELERPGRDPRGQMEPIAFAEGIHKINDLTVGMKVPGIVTNVTNFGAFVDIGVHQDGLVHVSHLSDDFVKDPNAAVTVGQRVNVTVTEVDADRKRIGLSMKTDPFAETGRREGGKKESGKRESGKKEFKRPGKPVSKDSRPQPPAPSMEDKLAQLMNKYKKR